MDESDLDDEVQDDEDLLSQPLQGSSQLPLDIAAQAASTSSLAHLNNLMNMHPQLLAKLRLQVSEEQSFFIPVVFNLSTLAFAEHTRFIGAKRERERESIYIFRKIILL